MKRTALHTGRVLLTLAMIALLLALAACGSGSSTTSTATQTTTSVPASTTTSVVPTSTTTSVVPTSITTSVMTSSTTSVPTTVPANWPLQLVGAQSYSMTEDEFRNGVSHHTDTYSDASGTWTGLALWRLVGWVDDGIQHGTGAFNDTLANTGYNIRIYGSEGYYTIFDSITVKRNDNIIIANRLNGGPLPAADPTNSTQLWYPLRIVGSSVQNGQKVGAIVRIELLNLPTSTSVSSTTIPPTPTEVEATEFQGVKLTPISEQGNAAASGVQYIDRNTYILTVDGLVDHPLALSYTDLLAYPQESRLMDLNCVAGWNFTAKWTGPELSSIFNDAQVQPEAKIAIFYTADFPNGYSSLHVNYIRDNNIIIALKDNDITLPPDRGFPFQVVAQSRFGYEWAKWVTRIELSSKTDFIGVWGSDNNADIP